MNISQDIKRLNIANLDLNLLKVLDALIEERSVTRAARRLGRTQPAVSNALARLRSTLGDELFLRSPGGLELTARAQAVRQPVRDLIALAEICFSEQAQFDPSSAEGVFRIAMPDRLGLSVNSLMHERLSRLAPNMSLHVRTADRTQAIDLLRNDQVDIALGWLDEIPATMSKEKLLDEAFFCLLRAGHPALAKTGTLNEPALFDYPHLLVSATGNRVAIFDELLIPHKIERRVLVAVTNFSTVPFLLADSDMIGVFTQLVTRVFSDNFDLVQLPVPIDVGNIAASMVWHARNDGDKKHSWLREQMRQICASFDFPAITTGL